jgi:hypothetical protein
MINIITTLDNIKDTNLVFLVEEKIDLEIIKSYNFSENIITKLENILEK